jgi:hypothetical protein
MILDQNFDLLGSIGVFNTLIWLRRYYEAGTFELHAPADYFALMNEGKYLYRSDRDELGNISEVNFARDESGARTAYCKGYFAEAVLDRRVTESTVSLTGTPEAIGRRLVTDYLISPKNAKRAFSQIVLGKASGIGSSVTVSSTGDEIGGKLYEIEQTQEMSHRLRYDYLENRLLFETWQGKDRTDEQTVNSWAIFADSFYNVKNAQYNRDESSYKNVAYVAGEGEGTERTVIEVDIRTSADEERREVYVDARDLQSTYQDASGNEQTYTTAQYKELLRQRGLEKLAEYEIVEAVTSDIDPEANLKYGTDFDLGDLCTYRYTDVGIECTKRITEIQETYEGSQQTLSVTFGTTALSSVSKLIKRET